MDYSEKWGTDIEEAVKLALIDLKLSRDEVEVIVLEQPSKGFFGIGSKLAKVRVVPKKEEEVILQPQPESVVEEVKEEAPAETKPEHRKNETRKKRDRKRKEKRTPIIPKEPEENLVALEEHAALDFLKEITESFRH